MGKLDGKVALISGAARGQGEAQARLFAKEGAAVTLADVLDDDGERVAASIADTGGQAIYQHLDVRDEDGWRAAVQRTVDEFGALQILINNAGIFRFGRIEDLALDDYLEVIQINQVGVLLGMKAAIPALRAAGGGAIVNTSSTAGLIGFAGGAAYVASKWAVRGMTKVAALELGPDNIRVNSVHPGPIDTPMIAGLSLGVGRNQQPIARVGTVDEVAKLMLFLASDDSSYCTGSEFVIDGGGVAGQVIRPPEE